MKKLIYTRPELQPVEFRVERGFAISDPATYDSWHDNGAGSKNFEGMNYADDDEFA